jgi:hypothetical protein
MKIGWDGEPSPFRPSRIRYEYYDPRDVWCHWEGNDYWNLTEVWVRSTITREDARKMGVSIDRPIGEYIEYWDRERYWIKIDGKTASDFKGEIDRAHGWGFVPFIYVPHLRANGFYGLSLVPDGIGLTIEINSRMADIGDAISLGVNDMPVATNLRPGFPVIKELKNGQKYLDVGRAALPNEPEPSYDRPRPPAVPNSAMDFVAILIEQARISQMTPEIAYGKEEGSQRSGQTLHNRMWPFLSHVSSERAFWSDALDLRAQMALQILAKMKHAGIGAKHLEAEIRQEWSPMVPLDRSQLVQELIARWQSGAISLELLLEKFGDIPNLREEVERILKMQKDAERQEAKLAERAAAKKEKETAKKEEGSGESSE